MLFKALVLFFKQPFCMATKRFLLLKFLVFFLCSHLHSQYYIRGVIKDDKGNNLSEVSFKLFSTRQIPYNNGSDGSFGFNSSLPTDTMYLSANGYENTTIAVSYRQFNTITLKTMQGVASVRKKGLASKTKDFEYEATLLGEKEGESYSRLIENEFLKTNKNAETGYGLNVDRAAYSNIRRFINNEMRVPEDAVRIEEMLNYFDFREIEDINNKNFLCKTYLSTCPWNKNNNLLFVNTSVPKINLDTVPPSNLVFLIDISGSMERPNRLPLLQAAFKMLVDNLRPKDKVAIVTYGGGVEVELPSTSGANKSKIKNVIDSLEAAGDTPGAGAIKTAYDVAKKAFIKGGNNRVILATDGDFNVGQTTDKELEDIISLQKQSGIYLTCIGVGMGNYKDSKLETLAKKGNGNFAYLDNIQEAEKVFLQEFTKTIYAVAKDAFVTVHFNKNTVNEYRLIGFDNKKEALTDINSTLNGGEIGSGHSAMAIFEINMYNGTSSENIADIEFQYKLPNADSTTTVHKKVTKTIPTNIDSASLNLRLATAICMYGSILKKSKYAKGFDFDDIATLLEPVIKKDNYLQQEFLGLLAKSENIYHINKKKKKKTKSNSK